MSESDTLDHITLDSDDILTIERFENDYYNHKNNLLSRNHNGGNIEKLEKNIIRLYNCYILSLNQNQDKLSSKIKRRLDKKLNELKILEGGFITSTVIGIIKETINNYINKYKGTNNKELQNILIYIFDEIFKNNSIIILITKIINSFQFKTLVEKNIKTIIKLYFAFKENSFDNEIIKNKETIISIFQEFVAEIINKLIEKNYIKEIIEDEVIIKLISNIERNTTNDILNTVTFGIANFFINKDNSKVDYPKKNMFSDTIINIITSKLKNYSGINNKELTNLLNYIFNLIFGDKFKTFNILINQIIESFEFKNIIVTNIEQIFDLFNLLKDHSFNINIFNDPKYKNNIIKIVQEFIEEILAKLDPTVLGKIFLDEIFQQLIGNILSQIPINIWNSLSSGFISFFNYSNEKAAQTQAPETQPPSNAPDQTQAPETQPTSNAPGQTQTQALETQSTSNALGQTQTQAPETQPTSNAPGQTQTQALETQSTSNAPGQTPDQTPETQPQSNVPGQIQAPKTQPASNKNDWFGNLFNK